MSTETPQRYSPLLISLHWAIAVLLLTEFILGFATRYIPASTMAPDYRLAHAPRWAHTGPDDRAHHSLPENTPPQTSHNRQSPAG